MNKMQSDTQVIPVDSREFAHRKERAVSVMVEQTLWTGGITFAVTAILGWIWAWTYTLQWAGTLACVAIVLYWTLSVIMWRVDAREKKPVVMSSEDPARRMLVHVRHQTTKENGHIQIDDYELPGTPEALRTLATAVLNGMPMTSRKWAGKNKPFSDPEWRLMVKTGIKKDIFRYKNSKAKNQGVDLTKKGRGLFEELADGDMEEFDE